MKVTFDIDCTPEEAREFLGLPKVAPMQERMMAELEERMAENIRSMDAESFTKTWFPMTIQGFGQSFGQNLGDMQKMFWSQMGAGTQDQEPVSKAKKKKA